MVVAKDKVEVQSSQRDEKRMGDLTDEGQRETL